MAYILKSDIQNYLMIDISSTFDTVISNWISAAEAYIENYTGRTFEKETAVSKLYDGDGTDELLVNDLLTLTKIEILDEDGDVDYTIDDTTEYYLYPAPTTPFTRPYTSIVLNIYNAPVTKFLKGRQNIKVTGNFGYADTVPQDIKMVAVKIVSGFIEENNLDITGEITAERLGEYSITLQDVSEMANHLSLNSILDKYRKIEV